MPKYFGNAFAWSLVLVFLVVNRATAATYYVAPTGSSSNDGSASAPWREIRDALPHLAAGDTVLVADGSFLGFTMEDIHGAAGAPITIKAVGANAVIVKTTDRSDNRDTIKITFCSFVVIDGLTAFEANRAAVRVDTSDDITIRNGVFGNNATWGIFTNHSDRLLIEGNSCYGSVSEHGIYVSNSCVNPIVRRNRSFNNRASGLHFNGDLSAGGGNGLIVGALVEKNVLFGNGAGGGAAINMDGVRSSTVRNNLIYNNRATGIALFQIDGALGPSGLEIYHNTIDMPSTGRWALHISQSDAAAGAIRVRNNILNTRHTFRGSIEYVAATDVANTDSDYNILSKVTPNDGVNIYTLAQWQAQGHEPHSLSASNASLFRNADGGDYHLLDTAPAVGAGQPEASVTDDLEGVWRSPTGPTDIGCFQQVRQIPGPRAIGRSKRPKS
jgi:hypothetical protein